MDVETLWAHDLGSDEYKIDNLPYYAYGVSSDDIVLAPFDDEEQFPRFQRVLSKSGNRTIRIIFQTPFESGNDSEALVERLAAMGCCYEGANTRYFAINIPPSLSLDTVALQIRSETVTFPGHVRRPILDLSDAIWRTPAWRRLMYRISHYISIVFLTSAFATPAWAKEWRGLLPLRSTQAEAKRVLGASLKEVDGGSVYKAADVIAMITYQTETCDTHMGKFGFGWNVPNGTIGVIGVIPLTRQTIEDYGARASFKEEKLGGGFVYYSNADDGLRVETLDGIVTNVTYLPTAKEDETLGCPIVQKCCWDLFPTMDEFGKRPRNETIARLEYLFVNVQHDFGRAVVIVSGPTGKRQAEMRRLKSLGDLRLKKYEIEPQRFLIADGGYADDFRTQLQIYPIASVINWIWLHPEADPNPTRPPAKRH